MKFLQHLTLKAKFILMLLIPLVSLTWFGTLSILEKRNVSSSMAAMAVTADLAIRISALVHETQKERGMTAGYLGSKGKKFSSKLPKHRQESTDPRARDLHDFLTGFRAGEIDSELAITLSDAVRRLKNLGEIREQVDGQTITTANALTYYTKMNALFLNSIGRIATLARNVEMASLANAYTNFLLGKERAGIERAVLTNTFARDNFGPGMYRKFNVLVSEQKTYTKTFLVFATPEQRAFYNDKLTGPAVDAVNRMRGVAFDRYATGGFGIDPNVWFRTITQKINLLKEVDDRLAADLIQRADRLRGEASRAFWFYLLAILAIISLAVVFSSYISKEMAAIGRLVQRIAQGDLVGRCYAGDMEENATGILKDINDMSIKLCRMMRGLGYVSKELNEASQDLAKVAEGMTDATRAMLQRTEQAVGNTRSMDANIEAIAGSSKRNSDDLGAVYDMATRTNSNLLTIAAAAEQANTNLGSVAGAAEQTGENMGEVDRASIRSHENVNAVFHSVQGISTSFAEVQKLCENASQFSREATQRAQVSTEIMNKLSESALEIESVVSMIKKIANQTNMLALNASIEAASAGEAGKGFAVVANEVKDLASQTGNSTRIISEKVQAIQTLSSEASSVTREVTDSIEHIAQSNLEILQTVDEQNQAVEEITVAMNKTSEEVGAVTRLIEDSMTGISDVTRSMGELSQAVSEVTENVSQASHSTGEMTNSVSQVNQASVQISEKIVQAADVSKNIANSMDEIRGSVDGIDQMSRTVTNRSSEMRKQANQLAEMLGQFRM